MLSEKARDQIRRATTVLQIIVLALCMGVVVFGIVAALQNSNKQQSFNTNVNIPVLAASVPMFFAGFVVPRLMPNRAALPGGQPLDPDPQVAEVLRVFSAIQTSTIVSCAMFEGTAFLNLVFYLLNAELVHAAVGGLCCLCILAQFPTYDRMEQRIEEQLRRQRED